VNDPSIDQLAEEIGRLQLTDPLPDPDPAALTARGRRGLRRRRAFGVTAAAGLVTASVIAVSLTAGGMSSGTPPVLSSPSVTPVAPVTIDPKAPPSMPLPPVPKHTPVHLAADEVLTPMPGVPAGDAALEQVSSAEAKRRCNLRDQDGRKMANMIAAAFRGGAKVPYWGDDPTGASNQDPTQCLIPGDSKPTAAALAAVTMDPVPVNVDEKLRNCSVLLWHDVRDWRIVASDEAPGRAAASLQLLSPSGRHMADCKLTPLKPKRTPDMGIWPTALRGADPLKFVLGAGGCRVLDHNMDCREVLYQENGRTSAAAARIELTGQNGDTHVVRPWQGWYAVAWAPADNKPLASLKAFDSAGKLLYQRKGQVSPVDPSHLGG
jgi:hypothetical protein